MPELALETDGSRSRSPRAPPALPMGLPMAPPQLESTAARKPAQDTKPSRLVSLDAYRGFIMLAMASSGFAFSTIARKPVIPGQCVSGSSSPTSSITSNGRAAASGT